MNPSRRIQVALVTLALAGAAIAAVMGLAATRAFSSSVRCSTLGATDPRTAMLVFLERDVVRNRPELGYGVAGPAIRHGFSCRQWATGNIPVQPFPGLDMDRTLARMLKHRKDHIELALIMQPSPGAGWNATTMLLDLDRRAGRWSVSYFQTAMSYGAPGG